MGLSDLASRSRALAVVRLSRGQPLMVHGEPASFVALALDGHTQRQLLERARDVARPLAGVTRLGLHPDDSQWWLPALRPAMTGGSVILGQAVDDGFGSEPVDAVL